MIEEKIKKVKLLALDVDGILTDGKIIYDSTGKEIKQFDVKDGYGIALFKGAGLKTSIISARKSDVVDIRNRDLKIDKLYQGAHPKIDAYLQMLKDFNLKDEDVCFMGDDITDLQVLKRVGFSATVADAVDDVKEHVDFITQRKGGQGAVREVIELILKTQGKWQDIINAKL